MLWHLSKKGLGLAKWAYTDQNRSMTKNLADSEPFDGDGV